MNHADHVALLRGGIPIPGGTWADLGSGSGAFTLALAKLLGPGSVIYSIDTDRHALREQEHHMRAGFPDVTVHYMHNDFTGQLSLPALDGIVMANSLHFLREKTAFLQRVRNYLKPGGRFILVEYNTDRGNAWVPYPLSYPTWKKLSRQVGFSDAQLLSARPSHFLGEIYSAVCVNPVGLR